VISEIRLRYFEGCPNWSTTYERLRAVLRHEGMAEVEPILERVETPDDAERLRFVGSPTILIDGEDPFEEAGSAFGLTCRVYRTPEGLAGSPTAEQLSAVLRRA
jgi:hypothetical protein